MHESSATLRSSVGLASLAAAHAPILDQLDRRGRFIYLDYPVYHNIGDLLINLGTEAFFEKNEIRIWKRFSVHDSPSSIRGLRPSDTFIFQGGGNLGDLWPWFQPYREDLMARYPSNPMVFLPQTVHFTNVESAERSLSRIAKHERCHVFVRDRTSLQILQEGGISSASLAPDMAHALTSLQPSEPIEIAGTVNLIRNDKESGGIPKAIAGTILESVDWHNSISYGHRLLEQAGYLGLRLSGALGLGVDLHRLWYPVRDMLIQDGVTLLSGARTVVTNRLHGMILGLLLGRNVIAFDNSYGKLSSYRDCWLRDFPNLEFVNLGNREPAS